MLTYIMMPTNDAKDHSNLLPCSFSGFCLNAPVTPRASKNLLFLGEFAPNLERKVSIQKFRLNAFLPRGGLLDICTPHHFQAGFSMSNFLW